MTNIKPSSLPENITKILDELSSSPAFAMSRGGRELFHTNFLAFILEQETTSENRNDYSHCVKAKLLEKLFDTAPKNVLVLREKLNFDLLIIPTDDIGDITDHSLSDDGKIIQIKKELQIVVVEVKLKSIPTEEQLTQYSDKLSSRSTISIDWFDEKDSDSTKLVIRKNSVTWKTCIPEGKVEVKAEFIFDKINYKCILLVPKAFQIASLNEKDSQWRNLSWCDFINISCAEASSEITNQFIKAYLDSTRNTIELLSHMTDLVSEKIKSKESIATLLNLSTHDCFKKRRIHDLIGKITYEQIGKYIYEKIKNMKKIKNIEKSFGSEIDQKLKGKLELKAFFTNSTPGFQIEFVLKDEKKETGIGVQLQGVDYRHYIRRNFTDDTKKLKEVASDHNDWLRAGGNQGRQKSADFKQFNQDRFLYCSRNVGNQSVEELIKLFKKSLTNIKRSS